MITARDKAMLRIAETPEEALGLLSKIWPSE
jgi:hypothetical protein